MEGKMETKQYLMQISRLDRMIQNKMSELAQFRELAFGLSAVKNEERVQSTPNFDKTSTIIAKIDAMERKLDEMIDDYVDKKQYIISQIDVVECEEYYQVLFARYIEKKTFEKIADEMHYSFRQTLRIHGKALKDFENKFGKEYLMS